MFDEQDASETLLMLSTSNKKYAYEYLNTYILYSIFQKQTLAQGGLKATKQKCNFASIIVAYLFCINFVIGIVTKDKKILCILCKFNSELHFKLHNLIFTLYFAFFQNRYEFEIYEFFFIAQSLQQVLLLLRPRSPPQSMVSLSFVLPSCVLARPLRGWTG